VESSEVRARLKAHGWKREWLTGWRNIAKTQNERTLIATVTPLAAFGHSGTLFFSCHSPSLHAMLLGCIACLPCDFVVRQKVGGTNMTHNYVKQFPVLAPSAFDPAAIDFILPRVLELTYTSHDLQPWAQDLGYAGPPFRFDPERRALLRAELDAFYTHLYSLTRDELRYILDPADLMGLDYPSETFRVLKTNEIRQFGEYRTQRLVLEAWDRLYGG
jgi:hypothetical protein